jgi:hypothetical protein
MPEVRTDTCPTCTEPFTEKRYELLRITEIGGPTAETKEHTIACARGHRFPLVLEAANFSPAYTIRVPEIARGESITVRATGASCISCGGNDPARPGVPTRRARTVTHRLGRGWRALQHYRGAS